ncbi:caspase family protein [Actinoplanes sp. NPDC051861]|uniref:caspase, EACC1-associated type n=1 Tax=Actinoplanes sp. NPDC051861 TaxID=3155170 RepID=UPI00343011E4
MRLPDPRRTWLLLTGTAAASADESLPGLPAVSGNLGSLLEALTSAGEHAILPEHAVVVRDPGDPADLEEALLDLAERDADTILFYFAGHGLVDDVGDLFLATTKSSSQRPGLRSLSYEVVRRTLAHARAGNRLVVLDCCYSGRAISAMGGAVSGGDVEVAGSYTLTSTSANRTAHAPAGEPYTAFTGALLDVLRNGEPGGPELLDMMTIYKGVTRRLRAAGRPRPEQQNTATVLDLALGLNRAWGRDEPAAATVTVTVPRESPPVTVRDLAADGTVLGVCFGAGTIGAVVGQQGARSEGDGGPGWVRRAADRSWPARIHVTSWRLTGTDRVVHPVLPLPHTATTFSSVLPGAGGTGDAAIVISVGAWHRVDLHGSTITGPSLTAAAKRLAKSNLHYFAANDVMRWDITKDGDPAWLVTAGFRPDLKAARENPVRTLYSALTPVFGSVLKELVNLSVYDAATHDVRGRIALHVRYDNVLHFQTLPGRCAALVVATDDKRRPLRRIIVDLNAYEIVADDFIGADPIRRPLFGNIGAPGFRLSADGAHIAISSGRTDRTVIYPVDGRGTASSVPGRLASWSPAGPIVAVCDGATLTVLKADARSDVMKIDLPGPATAAPVFSPDGSRVAVAGGERVMVVGPLAPGRIAGALSS